MGWKEGGEEAGDSESMVFEGTGQGGGGNRTLYCWAREEGIAVGGGGRWKNQCTQYCI